MCASSSTSVANYIPDHLSFVAGARVRARDPL